MLHEESPFEKSLKRWAWSPCPACHLPHTVGYYFENLLQTRVCRQCPLSGLSSVCQADPWSLPRKEARWLWLRMTLTERLHERHLRPATTMGCSVSTASTPGREWSRAPSSWSSSTTIQVSGQSAGLPDAPAPQSQLGREPGPRALQGGDWHCWAHRPVPTYIRPTSPSRARYTEPSPNGGWLCPPWSQYSDHCSHLWGSAHSLAWCHPQQWWGFPLPCGDHWARKCVGAHQVSGLHPSGSQEEAVHCPRPKQRELVHHENHGHRAGHHPRWLLHPHAFHSGVFIALPLWAGVWLLPSNAVFQHCSLTFAGQSWQIWTSGCPLRLDCPLLSQWHGQHALSGSCPHPTPSCCNHSPSKTCSSPRGCMQSASWPEPA